MKVVCVGDCGVDHYLPSGDTRFGGITANVARHARQEFRTDDEVHVVSCVGNDDGAELVLSSLKSAEIICHIQQREGTTPVQYIEVQGSGEKNFVRYDEGVLHNFTFGPDECALIATCDLLIAPVYLQIVDLFDDLMSIKTTGLTAIDFADFLQHPDFELLERHLGSIDIGFFGLSVNDVETISHLRKLAAESGKLLIVTLGADGSRAFDGDKCFDCPAVPVDKVVDTTGAGDAYAAAFLAHYCHGGELIESMRYGAKVAADVVVKLGSWS